MTAQPAPRPAPPQHCETCRQPRPQGRTCRRTAACLRNDLDREAHLDMCGGW